MDTAFSFKTADEFKVLQDGHVRIPANLAEESGSDKNCLITIGKLQKTGSPIGYPLNDLQPSGDCIQAKLESTRGNACLS